MLNYPQVYILFLLRLIQSNKNCNLKCFKFAIEIVFKMLKWYFKSLVYLIILCVNYFNQKENAKRICVSDYTNVYTLQLILCFITNFLFTRRIDLLLFHFKCYSCYILIHCYLKYMIKPSWKYNNNEMILIAIETRTTKTLRAVTITVICST